MSANLSVRLFQVKALKGKRVIQAACGGSHTLFVTSDGIAYVAGRAECVPALVAHCFVEGDTNTFVCLILFSAAAMADSV